MSKLIYIGGFSGGIDSQAATRIVLNRYGATLHHGVLLTRQFEIDGLICIDGPHLQPSPCRFNVTTQRAQIHVGALFKTGDSALIDVQLFRDGVLRQAASLSHLGKCDLPVLLSNPFFNARTPFRRNLVVKLTELLRHDLPRFIRSFGFDFTKVLRINSVRLRNRFFIPPVVASLVSTNQQHGGSTRIEGVQNTVRMPLMLDAKFLHIRELRSVHRIGIGTTEIDTYLRQQYYAVRYAVLFLCSQRLPPCFELIRVLDLIRHTRNITSTTYIVNDKFRILAAHAGLSICTGIWGVA